MKTIIIHAIAIMLFIMLYSDNLNAAGKERIAVLKFSGKNISEYIVKGVQELFEVSLYKTGNFEILERNKINIILKEREIKKFYRNDSQKARKIGKILSADFVVIGSMTKLDNYTFNIKFIDVTDGKIILADSEKAGTEKEIPSVLKNLSKRMTAKLKIIIRQLNKRNQQKRDREHTFSRRISDIMYFPSKGSFYVIPMFTYAHLKRTSSYDQDLSSSKVYDLQIDSLPVKITIGYSIFDFLKVEIEDSFFIRILEAKKFGPASPLYGTTGKTDSFGLVDPTFRITFRPSEFLEIPFLIDFTLLYSPHFIPVQNYSPKAVPRGDNMIKSHHAFGFIAEVGRNFSQLFFSFFIAYDLSASHTYDNRGFSTGHNVKIALKGQYELFYFIYFNTCIGFIYESGSKINDTIEDVITISDDLYGGLFSLGMGFLVLQEKLFIGLDFYSLVYKDANYREDFYNFTMTNTHELGISLYARVQVNFL